MAGQVVGALLAGWNGTGGFSQVRHSWRSARAGILMVASRSARGHRREVGCARRSAGPPAPPSLVRPLRVADRHRLVAVGAGASLALAATSDAAPARTAGSLSAATASSATASSATTPSATSPSATSAPALQAPRPGCARIVTRTREGVLCRRPGALRNVLHGSYVVPRASGGTVTVDIQNGKVTSVSQSSITLKSSDGFTQTYAVTGSARSKSATRHG